MKLPQVQYKTSQFGWREAGRPDISITDWKNEMNTNSLQVIYPYKFHGVWVFDDERVGLEREPFVSGADVLLDELTDGFPHANNGFTLLFSTNKFPGYAVSLNWIREEHNGNWYHCPEYDIDAWLCPALLKYFVTPPTNLYVQAERID